MTDNLKTRFLQTFFLVAACLFWHPSFLTARQLPQQKVTVTQTPSAPVETITCYDENSGLSQWHLTQMLQDDKGFMWFASWNGLNRFDGYDFASFKTKAGDGCPVTTDRIRDIRLAVNGNIYCRVDDRWYLFSTNTGHFSAISDTENRRLMSDNGPRLTRYVGKDGINFEMHDRQGNLWQITQDGVVKKSVQHFPAIMLPQQQPSQVRAVMLDSKQRYWVSTKEDMTVRIFDRTNRLVGYLTAKGTLSKSYATFGAPVYCMLQTSDGTIYLGSKGCGLFRIREQRDCFDVQHETVGDGLADNIYDIRQDRSGRLWTATLGAGIYFRTVQGKWQHVRASKDWKVRCLHFTANDVLMAATTEGLAIGQVSVKASDSKVSTMPLVMHQKEASRSTSLSNSAIMDILETSRHRYFLATESGGVNEILSKQLLDSKLYFRHYGEAEGLYTDVTLSLTEYGRDNILIVGGNVVMLLDVNSGKVRGYDKSFFRKPYRYSDAHPLQLPDGRWLFGLQNGAYTLDAKCFTQHAYKPYLALTGVKIEDDVMLTTVDNLTQLTLSAEQRSVVLRFAALDFRAPEEIRYAFRLHAEDGWTQLGHAHTLTLPDLQPGDYQLEIRSTDATGVWSDNVRRLDIHVTPKFVETLWFQLLLLVIILGIFAAGVYTYLYIRRINRQQKETLAAYMALVDKNKEAESRQSVVDSHADIITDNTSLKSDDREFMKRVMDFIQQHIADSDVTIVDMAEAAATSRSGLNRKMKQLVGITPAEFMREVRIKHACRLLRETSKTVSEITYLCGFTDPKYFSRCFKYSVGRLPTEYRNASRQGDKE